MINIFKNKYLPLKSTSIDYKAERYLINKIDYYLLDITCEFADKQNMVEKVIKKGYTVDEATEVLGINTLRLIESNLSRAMDNLKMNRGLNNDDISIINKVYLNTKLRLSIFNFIDLIPKK